MNFSIRAISFKDIVAYISEDHWKDAAMLPITPIRALSQQKNPQARGSDLCLWVAEGPEKQVLGFAGSLPAHNQHGDTAMGWNTCWWVDPVLGKEVALPLLIHFLKYWDMRVAFSEMTARTHSIISGLNFCHTREESLLQVMFRVPGLSLSGKYGLLSYLLSPLIMGAATLVNLVIQPRIWLRSGKHKEVVFESSGRMSDEVYDFIRMRNENDFYSRSREEWEWIGEYPWLVPSSAKNRKLGKKYPFSYTARQFKYEWLLTREGGKLTSVQLVSVRNGFMKVLYYYGDNAEHATASLLRKISGTWAVYAVLVGHPELLRHAGALRSAGISDRRRPRWTGISKSLREDFPDEMNMQLGDGDAVFT